MSRAAKANKAVTLYQTFHQFEPTKIGAFRPGFHIPDNVYRVGEATQMFYTSDKLDPETGEDDGWISYIHEHEGGVDMHLCTDDRGGVEVHVPTWIQNVDALTRLGDCEGFVYEEGGRGGKEIEAVAKKPYPEWYAVPSGKALLVIQSKRTVLAIVWGGNLKVEQRGVVG